MKTVVTIALRKNRTSKNFWITRRMKKKSTARTPTPAKSKRAMWIIKVSNEIAIAANINFTQTMSASFFAKMLRRIQRKSAWRANSMTMTEYKNSMMEAACLFKAGLTRNSIERCSKATSRRIQSMMTEIAVAFVNINRHLYNRMLLSAVLRSGIHHT